MKNIDKWRETKWHLSKNGQLEPLGVNYFSEHVASLQAHAYMRLCDRFLGGRIADLGCGEVPMYMLYRAYDPNPLCVDWGESQHDTGHADLRIDLGKPWSPDDEVDTVCLWDVLEHLPNPRHVIWAARDMLKGGYLIGGVPFMYWLHEQPHDYARYTEHGLRHLFEEAGLHVDEITPYGDGRDVLIDVCQKLGVPVPTESVGGRAAKLPIGYTFACHAN